MILLLAPVPLLLVTERCRLRRQVERWTLSEIRITYQEYMGLGLKDSLFELWLLIIGCGFCAVVGVLLLVPSMVEGEWSKADFFWLFMVAMGAPMSAWAVRMRKLVVRGRREGWFDEDD